MPDLSANVVSYSADYQRNAGTLKIESFSKEPKTLTVGGIPAMKKHTYRAQKVNTINWQQVKEQTIGETLVLAVDVAKVQQYALLTNQEHTQTWLMQWSYLEYTQYLIE